MGADVVLRLLLSAAILMGSGCVHVGSTVGSLSRVEGLPGPEDLVWDEAGQRLLVSATDRRAEVVPGEIAAVSADGVVRPLPRDGGPQGLDFTPHGISLVRGDDGRQRLYVISHGAGDDHRVLVYTVEADRLRLEQDLSDPLLTSPNDLVALPDGTIYLSNDRSAGGGLAEVLFRKKKATVAMYRGGHWSVAAERLAMPNGIESDGDHLYVCVMRENRVDVWDRAVDGTLSGRRTLAQVTGPDNLSWDGDDLIVAGHVSDSAFMAHALHGKRAPSVITRINANGATETLFEDPGPRISAASVAVQRPEGLWIGQVFDPFIALFVPE